MNFIKIAKETIEITDKKKYSIGNKEIYLPDISFDYVEIYSPSRISDITIRQPENKKNAQITVTTEDSMQAASRFENPFILNFANAYRPGGGFKEGSPAQEESLCRCSTLYKSISSVKAKEMYIYNRTHINQAESDYMLLSPDVCVFRDEKCNLIEKPFKVSVLTAPAPNKRGTAIFASNKTISDTFIRRIEAICKIAADYNYKNLILGAWGCGAFGNNPKDVANYFHDVIFDKGYINLFDNICFAVLGTDESINFKAFKDVFIQE